MAKPSSSPTQVLLIYQGVPSEVIRASLRSYISGLRPVGAYIPRDVTELRTLGTSYYSQLLELMDQCGKAIAVVTPDVRRASAAGNLWFESGLWLAKRPAETLLLIYQEHDDVEVISDLDGHPAFKFATITEVESKIAEHLLPRDHESDKKGNDRFLDGKYNNIYRVRDTIGSGKKLINPESPRLCKTSSQNGCAYRAESTLFISELLRMGRANWEHASIQSLLRRIGYLCTLVIRSSEGAVGMTVRAQKRYNMEQKKIRQDGLENLSWELDQLRHVSSELLERKDNPNETHKDPWTRLKEYFNYRIEVGQKYQEKYRTSVRKHKHYPSLRENVERFCRWAEKMISTDIKATAYYLSGWSSVGGKDDTFAHELETFAHELEVHGRFASDVAEILELLGNTYFSTCRAVIKDNLAAANEPEDLHGQLNKIRNLLPHNDNLPESCLPNIWPRDQRIKE